MNKKTYNKAYWKTYYETNKERLRERFRLRYNTKLKNNPDYKKHMKNYYEANKDKLTSYMREYGKTYRYPIKTSRGYKSRKWCYLIYERDNHTCQMCGATNCMINAHHIKPWKDNPALRYDLDNGITLCKQCHYLEHNK